MTGHTFLDPAILFFIFGMLAGLMRSNLDIPQPISRFLSLYLLMALGLKGGFALSKSGLTGEVASTLGLAIFLAFVIPVLSYLALKQVVGRFDAAAIAATFGSVSAVTFITATQHLETIDLKFGGHMAAAMALMESPAIILAVILANWIRSQQSANGNHDRDTPIGAVLREALTDGAQLLLMGAMLIGLISGHAGEAAMKPFTGDLFKGMLAFFLLDMGLQAAKHISGLKDQSPWLLVYALLSPLVHAGMALLLCVLTGVSAGNGALLMVLAASASYIAVPAVIRHAIPEANPTLYMSLSLGITFPFNILFGISLYAEVAIWALGH